MLATSTRDMRHQSMERLARENAPKWQSLMCACSPIGPARLLLGHLGLSGRCSLKYDLYRATT
jgi:hypothetical protein